MGTRVADVGDGATARVDLSEPGLALQGVVDDLALHAFQRTWSAVPVPRYGPLRWYRDDGSRMPLPRSQQCHRSVVQHDTSTRCGHRTYRCDTFTHHIGAVSCRAVRPTSLLTDVLVDRRDERVTGVLRTRHPRVAHRIPDAWLRATQTAHRSPRRVPCLLVRLAVSHSQADADQRADRRRSDRSDQVGGHAASTSSPTRAANASPNSSPIRVRRLHRRRFRRPPGVFSPDTGRCPDADPGGPSSSRSRNAEKAP